MADYGPDDRQPRREYGPDQWMGPPRSPQRTTKPQMREYGPDDRQPSLEYGPDDNIRSFRKGGRVHRTGIYRLHRGERVIPARGRRRGKR